MHITSFKLIKKGVKNVGDGLLVVVTCGAQWNGVYGWVDVFSLYLFTLCSQSIQNISTLAAQTGCS